MRKLGMVLALVVAFAATPALAVTDGEMDGNGHPQVGIMVAQDKKGDPLWRCSGTMIAPKVFLTAGHCTEAPAAKAEIWFDPYLQDAIDAGVSKYPDDGPYSGTTHTHPDYDPQAFWRYDLGVVILNKGVKGIRYGKLPKLDALDRLEKQKKKQNAWFTAVGFGLQAAFPLASSWKDVADRYRMVSYPELIQINVPGSTGTQSLLLSNNANTGGTCFGDSGGPNFIKDSLVIAGVTSFGKNGTCAGQGGVYRVDRADDLDWLYGEFGRLLR
mgnify:CR=1 FL=1